MGAVMVEELIYYMLVGLAGGIAAAILSAQDWEDFKKYHIWQSILGGPLGGLLFYLMHTEWSIPNSVTAFIYGFAFKEVVKSLREKILRYRTSGEKRA
jgi:hypothetical protein